MLRASPPLLSFPCLCSSARICSTPLRFFAILCLCCAPPGRSQPCLCKYLHVYAFAVHCTHRTAVANRIKVLLRYAFALHSRTARICSTPLRCLAAHTTPSLAFAFRHEALHCLCFAYRGKSDPSDLRLSTPLRCAFQLSLAFAPRCTAVTTVPLLSKLVSTMPLPSYAHISAPLQIISLP